MTEKDIDQCAAVYRSAYSAEPWREEYTEAAVSGYLTQFMGSETRRCYVLEAEERIAGLALVILIPGIDAPYLRVEDFCIAADKHRKGYGSRLMELLLKEAREMGCDSVLLGTQTGVPAHRFYFKNGFREIESVLLFRSTDDDGQK